MLTNKDLPSLTRQEKEEIFSEAAKQKGFTQTIIEKDAWVCFLLELLFSEPMLMNILTFKGGTSLSKCYNLISRFSEDIDLTICREALNTTNAKDPMEYGISGKEKNRRLVSLRTEAKRFVSEYILPHLQTLLENTIDDNDTWKLEIDPEDSDSQTILFHYPTIENGKDKQYVLRRIKLEFGARGEIDPAGMENISPIVNEIYPNLLKIKNVNIPTLSTARTFWEKVTILHALHQKWKNKDKMSRHYYDVYMLDTKGVSDEALQHLDLLDRVVKHKSIMFSERKGVYSSAVKGSIRLVPQDAFLEELKTDYKQMHEDMLFGDVPSFEDILSQLAELEKRINSL